MKKLAFHKVLTHPIWSIEATVAYIQNLEAEDEIREKMKARLRSFTNLLRVCKRGFIGISYMFLLIVVGKDDPIEFSWFLYWYLLHVVGVVARSCRYCLISCLWVDFISIDVLWWWGWINSQRDHICVPSGQCCWTCGDPKVITDELHSLVVM